MLLKEIKNIYHKELDQLYPKEEVDSMFYLVIEHFLGLERFILAINPSIVISKEEEQYLFESLSKLKKEHPIQYILGETTFLDMRFLVNEHVLIPRLETEELINWVLDDHQNLKKILDVIDIGTGSGCIAVSLAKFNPNLKVSAIDISKSALALAKKNALGNDVEVEFIQADILKVSSLNRKYDIIVSNPPYVREMEKVDMRNNVLMYEPHMALFVTDEEPLLYYKAIVKLASNNLTSNGLIYMEINQYLGKEVRKLMQEYSFTEIEIRKDIFGNDRMIKGKYHRVI